jgi:gliding motility-associated-like protein
MRMSKLTVLAFVLSCMMLHAQPIHTFSVTTSDEGCTKGTASLVITGTLASESVSWTWSTGQKNVNEIGLLSEDFYSVHIHTEKSQDSLLIKTDTTIFFNIQKLLCPILVPKYFSPNDDGYNDLFRIGNVELYPDFEFYVYNKWGQRVHFQKKTFEPWNGMWNGIPLPDATYYFVFFYSGRDKETLVKGDIAILR